MRLLQILIAILITSATPLAAAADLQNHHATSHFQLFCMPTDQQVCDRLLDVMESSAKKMASDFRCDLKGTVQIKVYPSLQAFHEAIGKPGAADWLVGCYNQNTRTISMVSPNNPGSIHTYDGLFHTAMHHVANAFMYDVFKKPLPMWLRTGIAMNAAEQLFLCRKALYTLSKNHALVPTLEALENPELDFFAKQYGFACSYALVAFLKKQYGWERVLQLASQYGSFEEVLGLSKEEFRDEALDYIDATYSRTS